MRPRIRRARVPDVLPRRELEPGEELTVFRIVAVEDPGDPALVESFKSRAELGLPPRPGTPEELHPSLAEGISTFLSQDRAAETAVATRGRLGEFVAEVQLRHDLGIAVAVWGSEGHLTVWGDPVTLMGLARAIVRVVG